MYGSHKNIKKTLGTGQDHVFSIIIAIFICKNPDIKCILSVFPWFPFYKNKKAHKNLPRCHSHRRMFVRQPSPLPPHSYMLHSGTSRFPHMLRCFPTRVELQTPRLKCTKGGGWGVQSVACCSTACRTGSSSRSPSPPSLWAAKGDGTGCGWVFLALVPQRNKGPQLYLLRRF